MTLPQLRGHLRAIRSQERQNDRMLLYITRAASAVPEDFKEFLKSL